MSSYDLTGACALVTGGAHRVGREIALALAHAGADVAVHFHASEDAAHATRQEIVAMGRRCVLLRANIADWVEAQQLGEQAISQLGRLDILVNSASSFVRADALTTTEAQFDAAFDVNLKGAFALSQTVARHMLAQPERAARRATIINVVDEGAHQPSPVFAAHGLSKAALLAMTRLHAVAFGPHVRVNAICPGPVLKPESMSDERWQALRAQNPLNSLGSASQVAECALFLAAGPQFVNGDCITLDGGARWMRPR